MAGLFDDDDSLKGLFGLSGLGSPPPKNPLADALRNTNLPVSYSLEDLVKALGAPTPPPENHLQRLVDHMTPPANKTPLNSGLFGSLAPSSNPFENLASLLPTTL